MKLNIIFSDVNVELYVDLFSEKNITIPVSVSNFPNDKVLRLFPSQVDLVFSSSINNLKKLLLLTLQLVLIMIV